MDRVADDDVRLRAGPDGRTGKETRVIVRLGRPVLGLCVLALAGCGGSVASDPVEFRLPVEVDEVVTDVVEDRVVATGTLRTRERVALAVETGGILVLGRDQSGARLVEGSRVTAGQLVGEITGEDARLAAGLDARRRQLANVEEELKSRRELFERGLISREEFRRAEAVFEDARLAYELGQRTEDKTRITTPIDGVVLELARDESGSPVADGQLVNPGFVVARIAPLDRLIADIDLVGPELARVRPGQAVRVRHYAFEGTTLPGTILRISPSVNPQTHTFRVEVEVDNGRGLLRPGMFVETAIIVERRTGVPVAPREAIAQRGGRSVVFVIDGQRAVQRPVSLGLGDDTRVEVRDGVSPGERIVVRGLETLTDGTRVRVVGAP
jgi:membrane fusion protein, multidrug efflux system